MELRSQHDWREESEKRKFANFLVLVSQKQAEVEKVFQPGIRVFAPKLMIQLGFSKEIVEGMEERRVCILSLDDADKHLFTQESALGPDGYFQQIDDETVVVEQKPFSLTERFNNGEVFVVVDTKKSDIDLEVLWWNRGDELDNGSDILDFYFEVIIKPEISAQVTRIDSISTISVPIGCVQIK